MIVADSNLIAYLLIPSHQSAWADKVFLKNSEWAIPLICRSELLNILALYMRHKGMTLSQAKRTMEMAETVWKTRVFAVPSDDILELTFEHKITAYDGEYVALAKQLEVPLVTFDKAVRKAFPNIAISAKDFLKT